MAEHSPRWFRRSALIGAIVGLFAGGCYSMIEPPKYESWAHVQYGSEMGGCMGSVSLPLPPSPSERAQVLIRDDVRLMRVVREMDLSRRWQVDEGVALETLGKSVSVEPCRGHPSVFIFARHRDSQQAKDLVIGVMNEFERICKEEWRARYMVSGQDRLAELRTADVLGTAVVTPGGEMVSPGELILGHGNEEWRKQEIARIEEILRSQEASIRGLEVRVAPEVSRIPELQQVGLKLSLGTALGILMASILPLIGSGFAAGKDSGR